jgi:hypothetical protein
MKELTKQQQRLNNSMRGEIIEHEGKKYQITNKNDSDLILTKISQIEINRIYVKEIKN